MSTCAPGATPFRRGSWAQPALGRYVGIVKAPPDVIRRICNMLAATVCSASSVRPETDSSSLRHCDTLKPSSTSFAAPRTKHGQAPAPTRTCMAVSVRCDTSASTTILNNNNRIDIGSLLSFLAGCFLKHSPDAAGITLTSD
jgi:hypothetical protein